MTESATFTESSWKKTRMAFLLTSILNAPFWAIFNMLPFILYKDMHATPLQITAIIILKPAVSLLALYWSSLIERRRDRLLSNLVWARVLSHLPFFFFPFVDNIWFFILSFGFYMMLARGTVPAWMEILKINIPGISRERIFAYGSTFGYLGAGIIPFALGGIMDTYAHSWRWIFPVTALISLGAVFFKTKIPISFSKEEKEATVGSEITWKQQLIKPWKSAWELIRRRPDFTRYQLGFMIGGAGLMIMQPALPVFFMDGLNLTYTELAVALTLCKGVGFAMTSPLWARVMNRVNIYKFNGFVTLFAFAFPLCLVAAQLNLAWLYFGYLLYGMMQGGSEMSWNLSGPLFARDEDSSVYSSVNVMTIGLRGCFVPAIGSAIGYIMQARDIMLLGGALCLFSAILMFIFSRRAESFRENQKIDVVANS